MRAGSSPPLPIPGQLYRSIPQVALRWGVHRATVYRLLQRGELASTRIGGKALRIAVQEVERYESPAPKHGPDREARAAA
jgi:excisionase family DNA binding protein